MEETLTQKIKNIMCNFFGHKTTVDKSWYFNGIHCHCKRCGSIQTKKD